MKRNFLLALAVIAGTGLAMAAGLILTPHSGEPVTFIFESQPEISFLANHLQIKSTDADQPVSFELDDIESISFDNNVGVESLDSDQAQLYCTYDGDGAHFHNIAPGSSVAVYNVSGLQLENIKASEDVFHVTRSKFGKGVFIVKINNITSKIIL